MLKEQYQDILKKVAAELGVANPNAVPRLDKVTLNMGIGTFMKTSKDFSQLQKELALIAGQAPTVRQTRKSIANFKTREGMPVGLAVTLRGDRMFYFLERLIHIALPRVRDFHGVSKKAFDSQGNYSLGLKEHVVFPEVPQADVVKAHGLQVTISIKNGTGPKSGMSLLKAIGIPFAK